MWNALSPAEKSARRAHAQAPTTPGPMSDLHFVFPPIATMASQLAYGGAGQIVCAASCPSSVSRRTGLAATNVNTLEQGSLDASAQGVLTRAQEIRGLIELVGASQRGGLYEGVYESGAGFGAELRKGNKRLRQTGFSSAFEAALERAKWAKADMEGLHDNAPQRPCAELNPAEMVTGCLRPPSAPLGAGGHTNNNTPSSCC